MTNQIKGSGGLVGGLVLLSIMLLIGWVAYKAISGVFALLSFIAPVLLIIALLLNHTVVTDYIKKIFTLLKEDTFKGILYAAGTFLAYPIVAAWLAFKAYTTRNSIRRNQKTKPASEDYINYSEVEDDSDDFLELPQLNEVKKKEPSSRSSNSYNDLFD